MEVKLLKRGDLAQESLYNITKVFIDKKVYQTHELYGKSALEAIKFWAKNGFTRIGESKQDLH